MIKRAILLLVVISFFSLHAKNPQVVDQRKPEEMKQLWKDALNEIPKCPKGFFEGRGIVMAAGGEYYLVNAFINLSLLRYKGCDLPVEIWYIGEEEYIPEIMEKLKALGAQCYDVTHFFDYPIRGFEVKPHAILASNFKEVMLIDADNICLRDPSYLFDCQEYKNAGALFWPDQMMIRKENVLWDVLELEPRLYRGQESGQLIIDKERCWKALNLCVHMNKESSFYYKHIHGDKDTFFLSFMTSKTPYHMVKHLPGLVFSEKNIASFIGFLQRDLEGEPLFCHATDINWSDRKDLEKKWIFYNLTDKKFNCLNLKFPWVNLPWFNFRESFGLIEDRAIRLLFDIKPSFSDFSLKNTQTSPFFHPAFEETHYDLVQYISNFPFKKYTLCQAGEYRFYVEHKNDTFISPFKMSLKKGSLFEPHLINLLKQYIRAGSLVLDIGANTGTHAAQLASLVTNEGQVICFEPQMKHFRELYQNLKINNLQNVSIMRYSVKDKDCSILVPKLDEEGALNVKEHLDLITLDHFNFSDLSFIRIATKESPEPTLLGAKETLLRNRPTILIEFTTDHLFTSTAEGKVELESTILFLESLNYKVKNIASNKYLAIPLE